MRRASLHVTFLVVLLTMPLFGQVKIPDQPRHYVEDLANVIDASHERQLNGILQELQQKTGAQYIILTSRHDRRRSHRPILR